MFYVDRWTNGRMDMKLRVAWRNLVNALERISIRFMQYYLLLAP